MATHATATKKSTKGRKSAAIALAIVGVAGLSLASAAQLGVTSNTLQAGTVNVSSCDSDGVNVAYTTGFANGTYGVTAVTVSGINVTPVTGCLGRKLDLTLFDNGGASLGTASIASITVASATLTLPASAATTTGVAVVISG